MGSDLEETPRDYLFYSGGGGTVRGHPYQSLGVEVVDNGTRRTGGSAFLAASGEFRANVTKSIGIVAFYDTGYVGATSFSDGEWQSGAGLGLRYNTGIGPIRLMWRAQSRAAPAMAHKSISGSGNHSDAYS